MGCLKCSKDQDIRQLESALDKSSPPITDWTGHRMYVEWFNPVWNCRTQLQNGWVELLYIRVQWMSCKTPLFCNGQATMNSLQWENKTSKSIYLHHIMYFPCQSCFHRTLILRVSFHLLSRCRMKSRLSREFVGGAFASYPTYVTDETLFCACILQFNFVHGLCCSKESLADMCKKITRTQQL